MFQRYTQIEASPTAGAALRAYVPVVLFNRGLALARLFVVSLLLGDAGKPQFGLYSWVLELITWVVPVMMLGQADVAERYAAHFQKDRRLGTFLKKQNRRLWMQGAVVGGLVLLAALLSRAGTNTALVWAAVITMLILARYQWVLGALRGCRAYGAGAGMETVAAGLFLLFAAFAARHGTALRLVIAYAASTLIPLLWYEWKLHAFLQTQHQFEPLPVEQSHTAQLGWFGRWTFARLLLVTTFGFVAISAVQRLSRGDPSQLADYGMAYRLAQLLTYVAAALWSGSYAVAARDWSDGRRKRAIVEWLRIGRWGAAILLILAWCLVLSRHAAGALLPRTYHTALETLLPVLAVAFVWHGMLLFLSLLGDLRERPHRGFLLWLSVVAAQLLMISLAMHNVSPARAASFVAWSCVAATLVGLLAAIPLLGRVRGAGAMIALLAATAALLYAGPWRDLVASEFLAVILAAMGWKKWIPSPRDRRAFSRRRRTRT